MFDNRIIKKVTYLSNDMRTNVQTLHVCAIIEIWYNPKRLIVSSPSISTIVGMTKVGIANKSTAPSIALSPARKTLIDDLIPLRVKMKRENKFAKKPKMHKMSITIPQTNGPYGNGLSEPFGSEAFGDMSSSSVVYCAERSTCGV